MQWTAYEVTEAVIGGGTHFNFYEGSVHLKQWTWEVQEIEDEDTSRQSAADSAATLSGAASRQRQKKQASTELPVVGENDGKHASVAPRVSIDQGHELKLRQQQV